MILSFLLLAISAHFSSSQYYGYPGAGYGGYPGGIGMTPYGFGGGYPYGPGFGAPAYPYAASPYYGSYPGGYPGYARPLPAPIWGGPEDAYRVVPFRNPSGMSGQGYSGQAVAAGSKVQSEHPKSD